MDQKLRVGILGATGMVGQRFIRFFIPARIKLSFYSEFSLFFYNRNGWTALYCTSGEPPMV